MFRLLDIFIPCLCLIVCFHYRYRRRSGPPLPPGPKGWPWVGNAFSIPSSFAYEYYSAMAKKFNTNILYLEAFGQPIVVLDDLRTAQDLLDKRSSIYSSRPHMTMVHGLMDMNTMFALLPYGNVWRDQRKLVQQYFSPRDMSDKIERAEAFIKKGLLPNILRSPQDYRKHLQECFGGLAMSMTYGFPIRATGDPWVRMVEQAFTIVAGAAVAGKYLVDVFPILRYIPDWMPGAQFKRDAREWKATLKDSVFTPFEAARQALLDGTAKPSFVSTWLEKCDENSSDYEYQVRMVREAASNIYSAAAETVVASILTFMLAMLKFPEIQRRAQQEVDSIVGPDRLPEFLEIEKLPFVSAVLKEVLRWHAITPFLIPHYLDKDDVYGGFLIPKDSMVIANSWSMLQDERVFPNPKEFVPERFLRDGKLALDIPDPEGPYTFGFGRRACPGAHVGLLNYHATAVYLLSLFDISPEIDQNGKPVEVPVEFTGHAIVSMPVPFPCRITPRPGRSVEKLPGEFMEAEVI